MVIGHVSCVSIRYNTLYMEWFLHSPLYIAYAGMLGAIIGSFLNVVIYRFHTGKSINGHSHCMSCAVRLTWYELVPLISYVLLQARCRNCGSYIPSRYFVVELLTAGAFMLTAALITDIYTQLLTAIFLSVLMVILVYDMAHTIIPDELSGTLLVLASVRVGYELLLGAPWLYAATALVAGAAAAGGFVFLWVISRGQWIGLGDAKLAFPLGVWIGLGSVASFVILSFWIGAAVSVLLLGIQYLLKRGQVSLRLWGRPLTMKSEIPFAPFLIASFVLTFFFGWDVFSLFTYGF